MKQLALALTCIAIALVASALRAAAVMGFLELAAALKFFRTAELRLLPRAEYFTFDLVLAAWVVIFVAAANVTVCGKL